MHKVREIEQHNCFKRLGIFRALKNPNENRVALSRLIFRSWVYLSFWSLNVWRWGLEDEGNRVDTILGSVCVNSDDGQERKKKGKHDKNKQWNSRMQSACVFVCVRADALYGYRKNWDVAAVSYLLRWLTSLGSRHAQEKKKKMNRKKKKRDNRSRKERDTRCWARPMI